MRVVKNCHKTGWRYRPDRCKNPSRIRINKRVYLELATVPAKLAQHNTQIYLRTTLLPEQANIIKQGVGVIDFIE